MFSLATLLGITLKTAKLGGVIKYATKLMWSELGTFYAGGEQAMKPSVVFNRRRDSRRSKSRIQLFEKFVSLDRRFDWFSWEKAESL